MKFNEKLILLRKKGGLSQDELAEKIGVSRQSISKWELAECEPNINKLQLIAQIFSVSIDYLINEKVEDIPLKDKDNSAKEENCIIDNKRNQCNIVGKANYWWVFILIGFIGVVICAIIPYVFEHIYCFTGHSGFIGYLEDWCAGAIVWKIGLIISMALFVLGVVKSFFGCKKVDK